MGRKNSRVFGVRLFFVGNSSPTVKFRPIINVMSSPDSSVSRFIAACALVPAIALATDCCAQSVSPLAIAQPISSVTREKPATVTVALAPDALENAALWAGLDDKDATDKGSSWRVTGDKTMLVRGAIGTPLPIGSLQDATIQASLRFKVPQTCADYTSVALAFYDETGQPSYAIVIFKNPGTPVGQSVLRVSGDTPLTLRPATWYTLQLNQSDGSASVKVWADGAAAPAAPQWTGDLGSLSATRVGVRVYGDEVEVADLKVEATKARLRQLNRALLPQPVFEKNPDFVKLYYVAWEQALAHVKDQKGIPQSPYMDEACYDSSIWIWDTCFMSLFTRYSPEQFPGIKSLSNFYEPMYDGAPTDLNIWFADNPPLFAWAERDSYQFSGDKKRLRWLLEEKQYLQKHYQWFQTAQPDQSRAWSKNGIDLKPRALGFEWSGQHNGMDNTPRFDTKGTLAIDAIAQQGLAALTISQLSEAVGDTKERDKRKAEYDRVKELVNAHYWDEEDGFYYDLLPDGVTFTKVRTPAAFWPVLAGMASLAQTARMAKFVRDPKELGGAVPWVTLSRSDVNFDAQTGDYWRGAMWLPTAYMGIRALGENGQRELADETAERIVGQMARTYNNYQPHTIWECYSPNKDEPSTEHGNRVRPDFCGWSALGPISLFIENVLGFTDVDASKRSVSWRLHQTGRHGIQNLRFGDITTDILTDGKGSITVKSNAAYALNVNGHVFQVKAGPQRFTLISGQK